MSLNLITTGSGANTTPLDVTFDQATCNDLSIQANLEVKGDIDGTYANFTGNLEAKEITADTALISLGTISSTTSISVGTNLVFNPSSGWIQASGASIPSTTGASPLTQNSLCGYVRFDETLELGAGSFLVLTVINSNVTLNSQVFVTPQMNAVQAGSTVIINYVEQGSGSFAISVYNPTATATSTNWSIGFSYMVINPSNPA